LNIIPVSANGYLRVGTPRISHSQTSVAFPAGQLSYLHAIAAMGSKFIATEAARAEQRSGDDVRHLSRHPAIEGGALAKKILWNPVAAAQSNFKTL